MIDSSLIYLQNRRMDTIAKNLGTDSPIYQREANKMRESLPPEFTREVNGVLHMYGTNKMQAAGVTYSDIPRIKEWRQIKDAYKGGWKDYQKQQQKDREKMEQKGEDYDLHLKSHKIKPLDNLNAYIRAQSDVKADLEEDVPLLYGKSEKAQAALEIMHQSTKSWNDMQQVFDTLGELKK